MPWQIRLAGRGIKPFDTWYLTNRAVALHHIGMIEPIRMPDNTYQLAHTGFHPHHMYLKTIDTNQNIRGASLAEAQHLIDQLHPVEVPGQFELNDDHVGDIDEYAEEN